MAKRWIGVAALVCLGVGFLTAEEQKPRGQRVSPSLLRESLISQPVAASALPPSLGHSIQDLRALVADLMKAGHKSEAERLVSIIKHLTRLAESRYHEKKDQLDKLQRELEELHWASER